MVTQKLHRVHFLTLNRFWNASQKFQHLIVCFLNIKIILTLQPVLEVRLTVYISGDNPTNYTRSGSKSAKTQLRLSSAFIDAIPALLFNIEKISIKCMKYLNSTSFYPGECKQHRASCKQNTSHCTLHAVHFSPEWSPFVYIEVNVSYWTGLPRHKLGYEIQWYT